MAFYLYQGLMPHHTSLLLVNLEYISHYALVFLTLGLSMYLIAGLYLSYSSRY